MSKSELSASCLCGTIKLTLNLPPKFKTICYCLDDRKITSSISSYALNFPYTAMTITSGKNSIKQYIKTTDHGSQLTNHFCTNCGTTLYREGGTMGEGIVNVKAGIIDDVDWVEEHGQPEIEVYVERRPKWLGKVEGAVQLNAKYEVVEVGEHFDQDVARRVEDQRGSDDLRTDGV